MVSHEPVISLCMSDLTGKTVNELGGQCNELEYAVFNVQITADFSNTEVELIYRDQKKVVAGLIFSSGS
jgi:hypothetical protein